MPPRPLRRAIALSVGIAAPLLLAAAPARAQHRAVPAGVHRIASPAPSFARAAADREAAVVASRADAAADGALIGALAGVLVAYAISRQQRTDHGTDFVAYLVFVPAGALVGAIAGAMTAGDAGAP